MSTVSKFFKKYSKFDPRYISGCTLWLDADDPNTITYSSGSNVATWKDKSVSANTATSGSGQPTYPIAISGRNTIAFDGNVGTYMTLDTSKLPTGTSPFSLFIISRITSNVDNNQYIFSCGDFTLGIVNNYSVLYGKVSPTTYFIGITISNTTTTSSYDTTNLYNTLSLFSNQATSVSDTNFVIGKAFSNPSARSAYNISTNYGVIGASATPAFNQKLTGNIGEIIIFNRSITNTERQQVEGYLAWKWGLQASLPSAPLHPYYTTINHGPVLSTFNLTDISGCSLWLDGYDPSNNNSRPANGATVSIWYDKSGNGNNAIQYLTNNLPMYNLTSRGLNFNSQMYALTNAISQIGTVFVVGKQIASNGNIISAKDTSGYSPYYIAIKSDTSVTLSKTDNTLVNFQALTTTQYNTITLISGIVTSSSVSAILNGGTETKTASYTGTLKTATQTYIGASWFGGTVSLSAASELNEIIMFTAALSTYEYQTVEGYLAWKWGLQSSLPSAHPYKKYYPLKIT